jgi:superfamily I DNA/RNA helicase
MALDGRCPVCGNRVTVGVAHRVEMLADRSEADVKPPATAGEVTSLVPLPEMLSELMQSGVASKAVTNAYDRTTAALGPELSLLQEVPVEDIARADPLLGEAVVRLRSGTVIREGGYDGEYGVIRLFQDGELDRITRGGLLFDTPVARRARTPKPAAKAVEEDSHAPGSAPSAPAASGRAGILGALDADQARAAEMTEGALVVIAGPGSGKTRMLTHRIAHLVIERGVPAAACLAVTFTRRATDELRTRLSALLPREAADIAVHSFHSLGLAILRAHGAALGLAPGFRIAGEAERKAALAAALNIAASRAGQLLKSVSLLKRTGATGSGPEADAHSTLARLSREQNWVDFDDLVALSANLLEHDAGIAAQWRARFTHVLADEFQDVDEQQYRLLRLLAGPGGNLCVIGDPNQAIYGFRGADATCFERLARDFQNARTVHLARNYRSTGTIVTAAAGLVGVAADGITRPMAEPIVLHAAANEDAEADFVAATIEELLGGHDLLSANGGKSVKDAAPLSFADFAVLYRTDAQSSALRNAFDRAGIPFKKSSPAPLTGHKGVEAILAALRPRDEAVAAADLRTRLAAAADEARRQPDADAASIAEARGWLTSLAAPLEDEAKFREQVALSTEADFRDPRADRVSLLTMHAAKGLEFSVVFVVGMEDGLTPFAWEAAGGGIDPEERRLFYVAMTRAKDRLFLVRAQERHWRGVVRALPPSSWLTALPRELIASRAPAKRAQRPAARQMSLF